MATVDFCPPVQMSVSVHDNKHGLLLQRVGRELRFLCKVSLLEIYQEVITDLLQSTTSRLVIREDLRKGIYVEGLSEEVVTTGKSGKIVALDPWRVVFTCYSTFKL